MKKSEEGYVKIPTNDEKNIENKHDKTDRNLSIFSFFILKKEIIIKKNGKNIEFIPNSPRYRFLENNQTFSPSMKIRQKQRQDTAKFITKYKFLSNILFLLTFFFIQKFQYFNIKINEPTINE